MTKQNHTEAQLTRLLSLARCLDVARGTESDARTARIKLECQISDAIVCPEEGQVTIKLPNGSSVCVKRSLIYKADTNAINEIFVELNEDKGKVLHVPLKQSTKIELDRDGYAWYKKNHPDLHKIIAEHVTVRPAKTSITRK